MYCAPFFKMGVYVFLIDLSELFVHLKINFCHGKYFSLIYFLLFFLIYRSVILVRNKIYIVYSNAFLFKKPFFIWGQRNIHLNFTYIKQKNTSSIHLEFILV